MGIRMTDPQVTVAIIDDSVSVPIQYRTVLYCTVLYLSVGMKQNFVLGIFPFLFWVLGVGKPQKTKNFIWAIIKHNINNFSFNIKRD